MKEEEIKNKLLKEVVKRQKKEHLSNKQFAEKLGISYHTWLAIVYKKRQAGWKVWSSIRAVYPDLTDPILDLMDAQVLRKNEGEQ